MLRGLGGGLLALIAVIAFVPGADAKPRTVVFPGGQGLGFSLRGSNGYSVHVGSYGGNVEVTAIQRKTRSITSYVVPRRKHGHRGLEAKLPGVGRIAVQFHPRGKAKRLQPMPGCEGRSGRRQPGYFVGTINFHGERGYTEATATRAKGAVFREFPQTCPAGNSGGSGGKGFEGLTVTNLIAVTAKGGVLFSATRIDVEQPEETRSTLSYWAAKVERARGMRVTRLVFGLGPAKAFTAEHLGKTAAARAEPRAPFTGFGEFAVAPSGAVSWTGDLSVAFPGIDPIRLTGKRFRAQLCIDTRCAGNNLGADGLERRPRPQVLSSAAPTPRLWPR